MTTTVRLNEGVTPLAGPVVFPGVPGAYTPGEPVDIETLRVTPDELQAIIDATGAPLTITKPRAPRRRQPDPTPTETESTSGEETN